MSNNNQPGDINIRHDLDIIQQWVNPQSHILDLACGDGTLLKNLKQHKNVEGYGLEIDQEKITEAITNGVNVIEADLDTSLSTFEDNSFDTVIMTQALQAMRHPDLVLDEMLRIGKQCIVTFPNFGHWQARLFLLTNGRMPVTKELSYQWYDTPNIHFCTVKDFEALCGEKNIQIAQRDFVSKFFLDKKIKNICPNLFSNTAIYLLSK